jgi:hypothetical protein
LSDQPIAKASTYTHHRNTSTTIHALSGIQTHDHSDQAIKIYVSDLVATETYIPEDSNLHTHRRENLKSHIWRHVFALSPYHVVNKARTICSFDNLNGRRYLGDVEVDGCIETGCQDVDCINLPLKIVSG